jgi:hypothetical protein
VTAGSRILQAWTIAKIELSRVFFARRSFWVYGLALLPAVIFFGHGVDVKLRSERLARRGMITPALMDSVQEGESAEGVKQRLGKPAEERWSTRSRRVRQRTGDAGTTTHVIEPTVDTRFVRLNVVRPSYSGEPVARIYEFEVYGPAGQVNLALKHPVTGSRQVVRPRLALVPAGGSGNDSSGDALRREARQCGRRKRRVRHPRIQHPAE